MILQIDVLLYYLDINVKKFEGFADDISGRKLKLAIQDILLELKDDGFHINSSFHGRIFISKGLFKFSEVEDYVERLKDFLGYKFTNIKINKKNFSSDWIRSVEIIYDDMPKQRIL